MTQIIAYSDISICRDTSGCLHAGIGIVFYKDEVCKATLIREMNEHRQISKDNSHELEWCAIHLALQEITIWCEDHVTIVICSDCKEALQRWQKNIDSPASQHLKVLRALSSKSVSVRLQHANRKTVQRAHYLAKCAAISQFQTAQARNTLRQLAVLLKH